MDFVAELPEKNTFIHFDEGASVEGPHTASAPAKLIERFLEPRIDAAEPASAQAASAGGTAVVGEASMSPTVPGGSSGQQIGHSAPALNTLMQLRLSEAGRGLLPGAGAPPRPPGSPPESPRCEEVFPTGPPPVSAAAVGQQGILRPPPLLAPGGLVPPPPPESPPASPSGSEPGADKHPAPASVRSPPAALNPACVEVQDHPAGPAPLPTPQSPRSLPSIGSAWHATGDCVPCAWFWKPQGCNNGAQCTRCHMCPEGEVKARKKLQKQVMVQKTKEAKQEPAYVTVAQLETAPSAASLTAAVHSTGVEIPIKHTFIHYSEPPCEVVEGPPVYSAPGIMLHPQAGSTSAAAAAAEASAVAAAAAAVIGAPSSAAAAVVAAAAAAIALPGGAAADGTAAGSSAGNEAHLRGECKPCSYFWYKADGCRNGYDCAFCHLCEKGENKKRKKERIRALKAEGKFHH
eukprot:CAMPEP_0170319752 /NCGR_PEP_ID=MMETSP0116_2-20130129/60594_1 /TAXON_ID=400756 /ORGANISM="Durinskia baltica, Strain CSIRO CS-38" /LENGTH=460 /DNA_ID=CAMNT_0010572491 /DNA_START=51 /DNA_END=1433 /DNA_ORIENTATION=+